MVIPILSMKGEVCCMTMCTGGCEQYEWPLAMTVMPMQTWRCINTPCDAMKAGTIFGELNLPFYGEGGACV